MPNESFLLSREYVAQSIAARGYATHIADLAIALAHEAGEPVRRPLTQSQIERAIQVNGEETRLVMDALTARLQRLAEEGKLPEGAAVPLW